jgi:hypothetical protein
VVLTNAAPYPRPRCASSGKGHSHAAIHELTYEVCDDQSSCMALIPKRRARLGLAIRDVATLISPEPRDGATMRNRFQKAPTGVQVPSEPRKMRENRQAQKGGAASSPVKHILLGFAPRPPDQTDPRVPTRGVARMLDVSAPSARAEAWRHDIQHGARPGSHPV